MKKIDLKFERILQTTPRKAFNTWLNPKIPGTPWNYGNRAIVNAKRDGLFYWSVQEYAHYGRFIEFKPGVRVKYSWMSQSTHGEETHVTVTFKKHPEGTLMTLQHTGLPNTKPGRGHKDGWNYFLDNYVKKFAKRSRKQ